MPGRPDLATANWWRRSWGPSAVRSRASGRVWGFCGRRKLILPSARRRHWKLLSFPSAFGMYCRLTGEGRYSPARRSACIPSRNWATPCSRWIATWLGPRPPPLRYCALASMLPTGRRSCRSGRTAHGNAVSYSAWHTSIACVGVLALYLLPGCFPFPACPRAYLYTSPIKAGPLPSSVLSCTPSPVLRTPRTPSWLLAISAVRLYTLGLCLTGLPGRVSPVPPSSLETCHRPLPRKGPAVLPVQTAVCCLRHDMTGSALSNTFRLKL
jgi:hypothetical protein